MVDEERLHQWIEQKLEQGVSEDRIKKSLENTGHDPSLVEEVKDPFSKGSAEENDDPNKLENMDKESDISVGKKEREKNQKEESANKRKQKNRRDTNKSGKDSSKNLKEKIPSFSMPSFSLPKPDISARMDFSSTRLKYGAIIIVILGIIGGGVYGLSSTGVFEAASDELPNPDTESIGSNSDSNTEPGPSGSGENCPDVGVRIERAWVETGQTHAEVKVNRGSAEVILEVYSSGTIVGSTTDSFSGTSTMKVNAEGDRVVFRPVDCKRFSDSLTLG